MAARLTPRWTRFSYVITAAGEHYNWKHCLAGDMRIVKAAYRELKSYCKGLSSWKAGLVKRKTLWDITRALVGNCWPSTGIRQAQPPDPSPMTRLRPAVEKEEANEMPPEELATMVHGVADVLSRPPATDKTFPTITIVICTRNRAASLGRTLESIQRLAVPPGIEWELIVVDNNSTDATRDVVECFRNASGLNVHYVLEPRRGASSARNAGIRKAKGDLLAFTDDDMILDREWLIQIVVEYAKNRPAGMYFGRTHTMRPDQAKIAVKESAVEETYVFPCNPGDPGSSNNMIVRRTVLESVGVFDPALGPGTTIGPCEDLDLTYRVLRSGATVLYCPAILAYHDHNRLSPRAVRKLLFAYGKGRGGFYCKHILKRDLWAAKMCYWEIRYFFHGLFRRGKTGASFLHLTGLAIGFGMRLGIHAEVPGER